MNVNKAIVVGRLTRDPEMRTTPSGQNVTNFSIATSRSWKDASGAQQEKPEYHNVVAWGKRGEVINQYCTKGQELYVEGRLETRSWDDADSGKKMYRTEIVMDEFQFGQKPGGGTTPTAAAAGGAVAGAASVPAAAATAPQAEEEIPTINLEEEEEVKIEDVPF